MKTLTARKRIFIVDDHPLVREGLSARISSQPDLEVVGEAASEDEALRLLASNLPDLAIVDISLKTGNDIELVKQAKARFPSLKVLVFSGFQESLFGERALRAGAAGYLNKQESNDKLLEAIRAVLRGERYLSPELSSQLIAQALDGRDPKLDPVATLSDRELEIFRLIGQGQTSGAIANQLHVSSHTIDSHRENIKRKLNAKNAGELTRQAVKWILENG